MDFIVVRYAPDWLPGTSWKNDAKAASALSHKMLHLPYDVTKEKIVSRFQSLSCCRECYFL